MSRSRTWLWWHTWTGVTTGLMLFVICWSGTIAVLSHEIDWLLDPALRVTAPPAADAGAPSWQAVVDAAARAAPGLRPSELVLPAGPRDAAAVLMEDTHGMLQRVYVNPYTAQVQGVRSYFNVQRFFRSLHMNLFFNTGPWGYLIVGAFAVPLLASLVTALMFYKRWWRRFFVLKLHRGMAIFWSDLHKTGGLWASWFALLMALTGAWYFLEAAGVEPAYPEPPAFPLAATQQARPIDLLDADAALARARRAWPELEPSSMTLPGGWLGHTFAVQGQAGDALVRDRANQIFLDPEHGTEQARRRTADLSLPARWVDTADPLHFGNFAGLAVKLLWFVSGLLLSSLYLTGAYLQVQRLKRQHGRTLRRTSVAIASIASLLLLGIAALGGWIEIRSYGSVVEGNATFPPVPSSVTTFIACWTAVTIAVLAVWIRKLR